MRAVGVLYRLEWEGVEGREVVAMINTMGSAVMSTVVGEALYTVVVV